VSNNKELILINWDYKRRDLTAHLYQLSEFFDIIFLYYYEEKTCPQGFPVISWHDYSSPQELIKKIKPKKILFHDIESFHQVGLNIAAHYYGIRTFVLEHGLRRGFEIAIAYKEPRKFKPSITSTSFDTIFFLLRTVFVLQPFHWLKLFYFIYARKTYGLTIGLNKAKFKFRMADKYINFTQHNASYIVTRDHIPAEKLSYIGNPQFDEFFKKLSAVARREDASYYVLFDTPLEEISNSEISIDDKISFYKKLSAFCEKKNKQLIIKLHPVSYDQQFDLPGVLFYRDADIDQLILNAAGCFFVHISGLLPLAAYCNSVVLFNAIPAANEEVVTENIITVVDFNNFTESELTLKPLNERQKELLVNNYLYKTDGLSTRRLADVLINA